MRALRAQTGINTLLGLPSPAGLREFLTACTPAVAPTLLRRAHDQVDHFERSLDAIPGRRRGLAGMARADNAAQRRLLDRGLRRALFNQQSDLLGYSLRCSHATMIVLPHQADPARADAIQLLARCDLTRTRPGGGPIACFGVKGFAALGTEDAADKARLFGHDEPTAYLMSEHCKGGVNLTTVNVNATHAEIRLAPSEPPLHQPATLVCVQRVPGALSRFAKPGLSSEWFECISRAPSRALVMDVLVHRAVPLAGPLRFSARLFTPAPPVEPGRGPALDVPDQLDLDADCSTLPLGLSGCESDGFPRYLDAVERIVAGAGFRADDLWGCRVQWDFPVLMSSVIAWLPLPNAPNPTQLAQEASQLESTSERVAIVPPPHG
jgi:hypothetical protein